MAEKTFGLNNPLSNKLWSADLAREVEKETYFGRFMGEGEDNIIQVKTETGRSAGDKITCGLVMALTGDGKTENEKLEGDEESMVTHDDSLFINELRHATRVKNRRTIDQQRVPYNLRSTARKQLAQWSKVRLDTVMFLHLAGYNGASFTRDGATIDPSKAVYNGNNTITAPTSTRIVRADNNSTDQAMTSATDDKFILELIDEALFLAKTAQPMIRPISVNGMDKYVCFLHPSQVKDLRTDVSTSRITWYDTQRARVEGGEKENGIYTGALGEYNGVILHESFYVPNGVHSSSSAQVSNTKRAILCGAQAGMVAWGRDTPQSTRYSWVEELFDFKHSLGIAVESIWGIKKAVYNSKDYGTIVISTYGTDATG